MGWFGGCQKRKLRNGKGLTKSKKSFTILGRLGNIANPLSPDEAGGHSYSGPGPLSACISGIFRSIFGQIKLRPVCFPIPILA